MSHETTMPEVTPVGPGLDPSLAVRLGLLEAEILVTQVWVAGFTTPSPLPRVCDDLSPLGRRHGQ